MTDVIDNSPSLFRLGQFPEWRYLLREFYQLYRFSSSGGSSYIRSHQKEVRQRLSRVLNHDPSMSLVQAVEKTVCTHLSRALDLGITQPTAPITRAIERIRDQLYWEYGYCKVPTGLSHKYAFSEFMGLKGPILAEDLVGHSLTIPVYRIKA